MNEPQPMTASGSSRVTSFVVHAVIALAALFFLNYLIATYVPIAVKGIDASYLIFFYHFPAAINFYIFTTALMAFSVLYLRSRDPKWDQYGRVAGEVGVLALSITLGTGSCWARMAWNQWWVWDDPRLMSAAIAWMVYMGYVMVQYQVEDVDQRRRWSAVVGILAWLNLPIIHYSIQWLGEANHPQKFDGLSSESSIRWTRWYGVFAFLLLYALIFRWKLARERVRDDVESTLSKVRRIEEGALA